MLGEGWMNYVIVTRRDEWECQNSGRWCQVGESSSQLQVRQDEWNRQGTRTQEVGLNPNCVIPCLCETHTKNTCGSSSHSWDHSFTHLKCHFLCFWLVGSILSMTISFISGSLGLFKYNLCSWPNTVWKHNKVLWECQIIRLFFAYVT